MTRWVRPLAALFFVLPAHQVYAEESKSDSVQLSATELRSNETVGTKTKKYHPLVEQVSVGNGSGDWRAYQPGYWAIFENTDSGPKFREVVRVRPATKAEFQKREIVFVGRNLEFVEPDYRTYMGTKVAGEFQCWTGALRTRKDNATTDYNPCESSLTDRSVNVGTYAAMAVLTLGLGAMTGTGTNTMKVSPDKIKAAINADLIEAVVRLRQETDCVPDYRKVESCRDIERRFAATVPELADQIRSSRLSQYRQLHAGSTTARELEKFKATFIGDDLDSLVAKTDEDLPSIKRNEWIDQYRKLYDAADTTKKLEAFVKAYSSDDPDNLVMKAQSTLNAEYARLEKSRRDEEEKAKKAQREEEEYAKKMQREREAKAKHEALRLVNWRRSLKIGDDTFCGPVIDLRLPMVKIAINIQLPGYASEQWLKRDQVYSVEYGCRHSNGKLSPLVSEL